MKPHCSGRNRRCPFTIPFAGRSRSGRGGSYGADPSEFVTPFGQLAITPRLWRAFADCRRGKAVAGWSRSSGRRGYRVRYDRLAGGATPPAVGTSPDIAGSGRRPPPCHREFGSPHRANSAETSVLLCSPARRTAAAHPASQAAILAARSAAASNWARCPLAPSHRPLLCGHSIPSANAHSAGRRMNSTALVHCTGVNRVVSTFMR